MSASPLLNDHHQYQQQSSAFSSNTNSDAMLAPTSQDIFTTSPSYQTASNQNNTAGYSYFRYDPSSTLGDHESSLQDVSGTSNADKQSISGYSSRSVGYQSSHGSTNNRNDSGLYDDNNNNMRRVNSSLLLAQQHELDNPLFPTAYFYVFCACFPVFASYGALVSLQERIRTHMNITGESPEAQTFDYAISTLFYVILAMRFLHNVIFSLLKPRGRVILGYCSIISSLCLLVFVLFLADDELHFNNPNHVWFIYVVYVLGGIGISAFECNFVSCITPLGPTSKRACLLAMPFGYSGISIAAFAFFAVNPGRIEFVWITLLIVAILNAAALLIFIAKVPELPHTATTNSLSLGEFFSSFTSEWRSFITPMLPNLIVFFVNCFVVILLSGAPEYVYNIPNVPMIPHHDVKVPKNVFLAVFNVCAFLGDMSARWVGYRVKDLDRFRFSPMEYGIISIAGGVMTMSTVACLAWPGMFLAMFANGLIYSTSQRRLDKAVDRRLHLTALSFWLLTGDAGSVIGSTLTHKLSQAVGTPG